MCVSRGGVIARAFRAMSSVYLPTHGAYCNYTDQRPHLLSGSGALPRAVYRLRASAVKTTGRLAILLDQTTGYLTREV